MDAAQLRELAKAEDPAVFQTQLAAGIQEAVSAAVGKHREEAEANDKITAELRASVGKLEANSDRILDEKKKLRDERDALAAKIQSPAAGDPAKTPQPGPDIDALVKSRADERVNERVAEMLKTAGVQHETETKKLVAELGQAREESALRLELADKANTRALLVAATSGDGKPRPLHEHFLDHIEAKLAPYVHWEADARGDRIMSIRDGEVPIMDPRTSKPATYAGLVEMAYQGAGTHGFNTDTRAYFASSGTGAGAEAAPGDSGVPAMTNEQVGAIRSVAEYKRVRDKVMTA